MSDNIDLSNNLIYNPCFSKKEKQKIMKEIEIKTEKNIINAINTGKIENPKKIVKNVRPNPEKIQDSIDILKDIMNKGAEEFKEKTGRSMTYSEMREMYG
jgi:hypothetical protein